MTNAQRQIRSLTRRDGNACHYCKTKTVVGSNGHQGASRDHIVPRSLGGKNIIDNFVLSCRRCNSERGNALDVCACDFCTSVVTKHFNQQFQSLIDFNRYRIVKRNGLWLVQTGGNSLTFKTWQDAMHMVFWATRTNEQEEA